MSYRITLELDLSHARSIEEAYATYQEVALYLLSVHEGVETSLESIYEITTAGVPAADPAERAELGPMFDALTVDAIDEHLARRTRTLRDFAAEHAIELDEV